MKRLKVTVTKEHIKQGMPRTVSMCPVALALANLGKKRVLVGRNCCEWDGGFVDPLPLRVSRFIELFDNNEPVKPFSFTLNMEEEA